MSFLDSFTNFLMFGAKDRAKSERLISAAEDSVEEARERVEEARKETQQTLQRLGELRTSIYTGTLTRFRETYQQIAPAIQGNPLKQVGGRVAQQAAGIEIEAIRSTTASISECAVAGGAGVLGGAVAACGAWGVAGLVGTASTGTAIGTLSGVAASNATLAWLGGGTLATGGAGVAGGIATLCGVAAAPFAIAGMWFGVNNGERKLNDARAYSAQADVIVEQAEGLIDALGRITKVVSMVASATAVMEQIVIVQTERLADLAANLQNRKRSRNWFRRLIEALLRRSSISLTEASAVKDGVNAATLLRQLLDMRLLDENGALLEGVLEQASERNLAVNSLAQSLNDLPLHQRHRLIAAQGRAQEAEGEPVENLASPPGSSGARKVSVKKKVVAKKAVVKKVAVKKIVE